MKMKNCERKGLRIFLNNNIIIIEGEKLFPLYLHFFVGVGVNKFCVCEKSLCLCQGLFSIIAHMSIGTSYDTVRYQ